LPHLQKQKINQPKLLQLNSRLLRKKQLRRLLSRSLRLPSPSKDLVRMTISKLLSTSAQPSVEAVEVIEVAVEAKEAAVEEATVSAEAAVEVKVNAEDTVAEVVTELSAENALKAVNAEDTAAEAVTVLSVESALKVKTARAVVAVAVEAEAVVEEVAEDSKAIAHKLLLKVRRVEIDPKVVSLNAELSAEPMVDMDPAITSTALLVKLAKTLTHSTENLELALARRISRRVVTERATGEMRPSQLLKVRLPLLKELLRRLRSPAERDVRESRSLSLKRLKKRKKLDLPSRTT
jgi:hypothetical protein